jgi:hypothetical protein
MPVSASRDFIYTRDTLIQAILRKLKVIVQGGTPTVAQYAGASEALNVMQLDWQNEGIFLWTNSELHLAITADTPSITASSTADTIEISNVIYRENQGDIALKKMTLSEYMALPNKIESGTPTHYYPEYLLASTKIYLFPVYSHTTGVVTGTDANTYLCSNDHTSDSDTHPTTGTDYANDWEATTQLTTGGAWVDTTAYYSGHIRLTRTYRLQDLDASGNNPDFHARAYAALVWGGAAALAPEYKNLTETRYFEAKANEYFKRFLFGQAETGSMRIIPRINR